VEAEQAYFEAKLPTAIGGAVKVGDYLYGTTGQGLLCVNFVSGQIKWEDRQVFHSDLAVSVKATPMDSHNRIKCGHLLSPSNLRNISPGMPLMDLSNRLIFNNPHINHHRNSANQEATLRCSQPYNIQVCKEWAKGILHQAVVFTNLSKVLSSSCSQIHQALNQVLRAGQPSSLQGGLVVIGATSRESSNYTNHYVLRT